MLYFVKKITVLPFGSILTQLPLIVIGALYMLYLGMCAVNRSKDDTLVLSSETKEHFIDLEDSGNTIDYLLLSDLSKEKSSAHSETLGNSYNIICFSVLSFKIPDQDLISREPEYCLLTRPPPVFI